VGFLAEIEFLGLFSREQFIYLWIEINKLKIARLGWC